MLKKENFFSLGNSAFVSTLHVNQSSLRLQAEESIGEFGKYVERFSEVPRAPPAYHYHHPL